MKVKGILLIIALLLYGVNVEAQFWKKLEKRVKDGVEEAIYRKTEEKATEKTENAIDSIFEAPKKVIKRKNKKGKNKSDEIATETSNEDTVYTENDSEEDQTFQNDSEENIETETTENLKPWSNYNFVPGDKIIFQDDLVDEESGEFPSRWDLITGSAENASLQNENIINLLSNTIIKPLMNKENYLPDIFTIEFDGYFFADENAYQTAKHQQYRIYFTNSGKNYTPAGSDDKYYGLELQRNGAKFNVEVSNVPKNFNGYKEELNITPIWRHFAIAFNKRSLKVFVDQHRVLNIPNMGKDFDPNSFSIKAYNYGDGYVNAIKNIRVAEGGKKLYDRVVADGKFVTRGILFDINRARLKPESMGVINRVAKMMQQHSDLNFRIEGHTDSDGDDASNLKLSSQRANAVKEALLGLDIDESRLQTEGKGESVPVSENTTPEGKANNRRVEFIKI